MERIEAVLSALEKEAEKGGVPIIRASEREAFLAAAALAAPRRILEIGTAIGFSALLLAQRFPHAHIDTIELDAARHRRAEKAVIDAGLSDRVFCHHGDAASLIPTMKGPYDLLYLDGPKGQYLRHLHQAEPLLSEKAVILADNVLFRGLVRSQDPVPHRYRTLVMRLRDYLSYVADAYDTTIDEKGDGLSVSRKDIE